MLTWPNVALIVLRTEKGSWNTILTRLKVRCNKQLQAETPLFCHYWFANLLQFCCILTLAALQKDTPVLSPVVLFVIRVVLVGGVQLNSLKLKKSHKHYISHQPSCQLCL